MSTYELNKGGDVSQFGPRDYPAPTVVRILDGNAFIGYAVFGTSYGYVHTTRGAMKLYSTKEQAAAAAAAALGLDGSICGGVNNE